MPSIVGRLFKAFWLGDIAAELGDPPQIAQSLEVLQQCDLTQLEREAT